ncbi:hypothetical protein GGX14DRAFT_668096 [Mycena pura]|uniref:Uncharacterized protein n=1 Tax=Mycena pura TaxID=153505 RepID=A0AAD6Y9B1_9AGAR|nr:hypothetical protein GGX14DRAFT_668096 [Mycena pura]
MTEYCATTHEYCASISHQKWNCASLMRSKYTRCAQYPKYKECTCAHETVAVGLRERVRRRRGSRRGAEELAAAASDACDSSTRKRSTSLSSCTPRVGSSTYGSNSSASCRSPLMLSLNARRGQPVQRGAQGARARAHAPQGAVLRREREPPCEGRGTCAVVVWGDGANGQERGWRDLLWEPEHGTQTVYTTKQIRLSVPPSCCRALAPASAVVTAPSSFLSVGSVAFRRLPSVHNPYAYVRQLRVYDGAGPHTVVHARIGAPLPAEHVLVLGLLARFVEQAALADADEFDPYVELPTRGVQLNNDVGRSRIMLSQASDATAGGGGKFLGASSTTSPPPRMR